MAAGIGEHRYVQQLCKNLSQKREIEQSDEAALIRFPAAAATMAAGAERLIVRIRAEDEATIERMKEVVANHLDRFAFREAPLPFGWFVIEGGTGFPSADQLA